MLMNKYKSPFLITLTLGVLTAIGSISIDIYLPAFEVMALYFSVPIVQIEKTVTLFLLGMATGQLFIGPVSDVWGRRLPLKLGLITYILCSIGCLLTNSFEVFLALRFIQGLSGSACQVVSRALVNDIYTGKEASPYVHCFADIDGYFAYPCTHSWWDVSRRRGLEITLSNHGDCLRFGFNRLSDRSPGREASGAT